LTFECALLGGSVAKTDRRFSTEFKLGVIESYLAGHGSAHAFAEVGSAAQ
jgi:hypothetical protein